MQDTTHTNRLIPPQARLLAAAALLSGALVAGCGGSSSSSTALAGGTTSSGSTPPSAYQSGPLGFAECMRANGVPNFPDPSAGGGALFAIPAGTNPAAPVFKTARAKCQKFMGAGPPVPGSTSNASARTLGKLVKIAVCMRQHGVPQFPDPRTTVPANPSAIQEITDFNGAILLFPSTINLQAPAYRQALTACGAPPLGLPH